MVRGPRNGTGIRIRGHILDKKQYELEKDGRGIYVLPKRSSSSTPMHVFITFRGFRENLSVSNVV